jgi:hypothetical protein
VTHTKFIDENVQSQLQTTNAINSVPSISVADIERLHRTEDLCDFLFVYLNYQFNYCDTSFGWWCIFRMVETDMAKLKSRRKSKGISAVIYWKFRWNKVSQAD